MTRARGTVEECEAEMRRLSNGERGCEHPEEHAQGSGRHARGPLVRAYLTRPQPDLGREVPGRRPEPNFPMPNDRLAWSITHSRGAVVENVNTVVIASTYYTDDVALVLVLHQGPPYFGVVHYVIPKGEIDWIARHENIVPAVDEYKDNGGDY